MNSDIGYIISFIFLCIGVIREFSQIRCFIKKTTVLLKNEKIKSIRAQVINISAYIIIVLIIPLFVIITTWGNKFSLFWLLLQILSWLLIGGFIGALVMIFYTLFILKKNNL